jgi:hypothetical protein
VKPDSWNDLRASDQQRKLVRQATGLHRLAIRAAANQRTTVLPYPERYQFLGLLTLQSAQFVDCKARKCDHARLPSLRGLEAKPGLCLLQALDDTSYTAIKIKVTPSERQDLAAPHTGCQRDQRRPIHSGVTNLAEQLLRLFGAECGHLAALDLRQLSPRSLLILVADRRLTPETYHPRAYTPLIDACYETIKTTEELVARRRDRPRIVVVFQTDGEENASREHSLDELRDLIERRKAEDWQFVFLGADIDAYATASSLGILKEETLAYAGSLSLGTFQEMAEMFSDVAQGRAQRVRFSGEQRRAAGDRFDPEVGADDAVDHTHRK